MQINPVQKINREVVPSYGTTSKIVLLGSILGLGLAMSAANPACAVNLVTNGDFETGNLTGWSGNGASVGNGNNSTNVAYFGFVGSLGFISQTITTVAGQNYQLSYDLFSDNGMPNEFKVQINGTTLFDQTDIPGQPFTTYSFNFTGTGSDILQFGGRNDPTWLQLDNVVVDVASSTAVPEPFTVIGTLVGGTAAVRMRKKLARQK